LNNWADDFYGDFQKKMMKYQRISLLTSYVLIVLLLYLFDVQRIELIYIDEDVFSIRNVILGGLLVVTPVGFIVSLHKLVPLYNDHLPSETSSGIFLWWLITTFGSAFISVWGVFYAIFTLPLSVIDLIIIGSVFLIGDVANVILTKRMNEPALIAHTIS
jgi:hypothetical protein